MQQIKSLFFFIGLSLLIVNCDATKKSNNDNNKSDEVTFGKIQNLTLGNTKDYQSIKLPDAKVKMFFVRKFDNSKGFNNFKIISKNEKDYYLICKGSREGDDSQFAIELEVSEQKLILQDVNKLYYTCIARYCDACSFKYNKNGTIGGCDCEKQTKDKPTGYAACEHTIAIKTEEKE